MKKILSAVLLVLIPISWVSASFMYQEIDPICSITGTTHTSFPWEISDTSSWNIPTAYDGECLEYEIISDSEKDRIFMAVSWYLNEKGYVDTQRDFANINAKGRVFIQETYFPALQMFIQREVQKSEPNLRHLAIISYAAKIIGYDYTLSR